MSFAALVRQLRKILGDDGVLHRREDLLLYEYDAGFSRGLPGAVLFPRTTAQVVEIMKLANQAGVSVVPRGAGTGLSGGAISRDAGLILAFSRMNCILEIDLASQRAVVQPGVVNLELTRAVEREGYYFAPDPSSQKACTIGGNVAENSGGPHTLAYGVTVNHVTGLEVVLPDARVLHLGGKAAHAAGYDLTGFFVGSEGTLGIATVITVKLTRLPESAATLLGIYNTIDDAANTVVAITAAGITPAALEMLDGWTLRVVEEAAHAGYPLDSGAVLLIEVEGLREAVEEQAAAIERVCLQQKAREVRRARSAAERELLWKGRKNAFASLGRLSSSYYTQDGVVPRTKIPQTLRFVDEVGKKYGLRIGNIFHAGDGNLHPCILFDVRDKQQTARTLAAGRDILEYCISLGGTLTGEHGIGMEKSNFMPMLFSEENMEVMQALRQAFNPRGLLNPMKLLPTTRGCRELRTPLMPRVVA
ncbi:MAG TPA: FAD-linked oxidase C-terminal domain-containing protein [Terriglobales bacterium]|nr:FAD-linked oxidase C-terminal domain-containing protein [Terriglobales bacterium]